MAETMGLVARFVARNHRLLAIALQMGLVVASYWLAFMLRFDGDLTPRMYVAFWLTLPWLVAIRAFTFVPFRLYDGVWRYTSIFDLQAIAGGVGASSLLFYLYTLTPLGPGGYPRSIFVLDAVLLTLMLGAVRLAPRVFAELMGGRPGRRVLVFGAGDAGELVVRDMKTNTKYGYLPVGFVDDDEAKVGQRIHGVPVLGTRRDLAAIIARHRPHEVLLTVPGADPVAVRSIVRSLESFKIPIKTLPNLRDLIDGRAELSQIRSLSVEDLLARAPVGLDPAPLRRLVAGRRVLVTGAGGSIGSELCRQIAALRPAALVMLERYENSLHAIRTELEDANHRFGLRAVIGDVTDPVRVREVMEQCRPEIVFHAAAHKHVPLMEENPCEAIKNNVRGTRLLAEAAEQHGVDRFILISTDKAVNPTSVMGASKRIAELVIHARAPGSGTSFAIVRFGNVLGSNGSVVPRFLEQIRKGGPVTITHPEIRRFFMLIPEAVQLVLHAAAQAESGATYVLEMGDQVKLLDMARDLIRLSGFVPEEEIPIAFVGLRPGEKLYEELVGRDEVVGPSHVEKILRVTSRSPLREDIGAAIPLVETAAAAGRRDEVLQALAALAGLSAGDAGSTAAPAPAVEPVLVPEVCGVPSLIEQPCPHCQSARLHRSRARTIPERIRRRLSARRLFRCDDCGWRGWLVPLEFSDPSAALPADAPDIAVLDSALQDIDVPLRPSFSPRDLQAWQPHP